jgi:hypothetical protein
MNFLNNIPFFKGSSNPNDRISLFYALMTMLPFGQLWARIFWLDGSLDKSWLLFPIPFFAPPFSIIPALAMYFGFIKKGPGGRPYDIYMWIPIIFKFLLAYLVPMFLQLFNEEDDELDESKILLYSFIFQIVIGMIPNLIRTYKTCNKLTFNSFGKAFVDSTIAIGFSKLIPFILEWMPFIGIIISIITMIPTIGEQIENIFWSISFFFSYVFINMINGNNINKYCNTGFFGRDSMDTFGFIFMLFITYIL